MATNLTIQEAAAQTGVTAHTLRYYERIGLLHPIALAGGGAEANRRGVARP